MKLAIEPGKYVVAVSGGVDSMVLLDLLVKQKNIELVVAHFDHGIRIESGVDREFVQEEARRHGLAFAFAEGRLGPKASEDMARKARYTFLGKIKAEHGAKQIITAHHQDDVIETVLLNILRGTGRKGIASLGSTEEILRPLLDYPKQELLRYAEAHGLTWLVDKTNEDESYLRNYVRLRLVPKLSAPQRKQLLKIVKNMQRTNAEIDQEIAKVIQESDVTSLEKRQIISASYSVACEVMAGWLRANGLRDFNRQGIERLVVGVKTRKPGVYLDVFKHHSLLIGKDMLHITFND